MLRAHPVRAAQLRVHQRLKADVLDAVVHVDPDAHDARLVAAAGAVQQAVLQHAQHDLVQRRVGGSAHEHVRARRTRAAHGGGWAAGQQAEAVGAVGRHAWRGGESDGGRGAAMQVSQGGWCGARERDKLSVWVCKEPGECTEEPWCHATSADDRLLCWPVRTESVCGRKEPGAPRALAPVLLSGPAMSRGVGSLNIQGACSRHSRARSASASPAAAPPLPAAAAAAGAGCCALRGTSSRLPLAAECITTLSRLRMVRVLPVPGGPWMSTSGVPSRPARSAAICSIAAAAQAAIKGVNRGQRMPCISRACLAGPAGCSPRAGCCPRTWLLLHSCSTTSLMPGGMSMALMDGRRMGWPCSSVSLRRHRRGGTDSGRGQQGVPAPLRPSRHEQASLFRVQACYLRT